MEQTAPIYINNAGLVLCSPYLPHFFEKLELTRDGRFVSAQAQANAVHWLQFLVNENYDAPENELTLNKILCGMESGSPLEAVEPMRQNEKDLAMGLLNAMIANWSAIHSTSVTGLRETFLQRQGKLTMADNRWELHVQRKALDVLVDQVPWSFSMIKYPWMDSPLHVSW